MLFLQFVEYSLSFADTPKNEIRGGALEICQLKGKQFSPDILRFCTKHKENLFALNCFMILRTILFTFHAGSRRLGSNNFRNSSYKEKTAGSARVSRLSFRFLWLCFVNSLGYLQIYLQFVNLISTMVFKHFYITQKLAKLVTWNFVTFP